MTAEQSVGAGTSAEPEPVMDRAVSRRFMWLRRFRRHRGGFGAAIVLVAIALFVIVVPIFSPSGIAMDLSAPLQPPSFAHLLGTDQFGRSILARLAEGGRVTLEMGFVAVGIAFVLGVPLGLVAAYYEGWPATIIMRLMDIMLAFPGLLLALIVIAVLGQGIVNVMIAVGISLIPSYVRLMRGSALATKHDLYVEAARSIGSSSFRIVRRHIVPNSLAPMIVLASVSAGWAIVIAASPELSRNGSAVSSAGVGLGSQQWPSVPERGVVDQHLPRARDYGYDYMLQSSR